MIRDRLREGNKGLFGGMDGGLLLDLMIWLAGYLLYNNKYDRLQKIVSGPVSCVAHQDQVTIEWRIPWNLLLKIKTRPFFCGGVENGTAGEAIGSNYY